MDYSKLKKGLNNKGYVSVLNRQYEVTTSDGTSLGNVSYNAAKAIEGNNLDSYKPKNEEEEKVFSYLKASRLTDSEQKDRQARANYAVKQANGEIKTGKDMSVGEGLLYYPALATNAAFDAIESAWNYGSAGTSWLLEGITSGFGLAPNSVSESFKQAKENSLNKETIGEKRNNALKNSYYRPEWVKTWVEPTVEAAGSLLPSIAVGVATGGTSLAANGAKGVGTALKTSNVVLNGSRLSRAVNTAKLGAKSFFTPSSTAFGLSAAGGSAKAAYRESGNANRALTYGAASGLLEMSTERLFGGIAGTDIGESVIKWGSKNKTLNKIFTNSVVKRGLDTLGEGVEETISAALDPYLRRATFDPNAKNATLEEYGMSAMQGMLLSGVMGIATYPVKKANIRTAAKSVNSAFEELSKIMPGENIPSPLNVNLATESQVKKSQEKLKELAGKYEETISDYYDKAEKSIGLMRKELAKANDSVVSEQAIAAETDAVKRSELQKQRIAQLDYIADMGQSIDDLGAAFTSGADYQTLSRLVGNQVTEKFEPGYIDNMSGEVVAAVQNGDGSFSVRDAYGNTKVKSGEVFNSRYTQLTNKQIAELGSDESDAPYSKGEGLRSGANAAVAGTGALNSTIASKFTNAAHNGEIADDSTKAMTATITQRMAERGTADNSTLRGYAQSYVNMLREKGSVGYASAVSQTDNLSEALIEHSFGASSGYVTEALSDNMFFTSMAKEFKNAFLQTLDANARYADTYKNGNQDAAKAQVEAVRGGDYSSLMAVENVSLESQVIEEYDAVVDDIMTVDDRIAKKFAENRVVVEVLKETPDVILENVEDANNLSMIMNYNKLYLAVRDGGVFKGHYHNLGTETAKMLPNFLTNPDAIIRLSNGRLNVFATVNTGRGNNGIISVELNSTKDIGGRNREYNVIVTMFSSDDKYVKNLVSQEGVTLVYEKKDLPQVNPQLYTWLATINGKPSDNNISQNDNIVKDSIREDEGKYAMNEMPSQSANADSSPRGRALRSDEGDAPYSREGGIKRTDFGYEISGLPSDAELDGIAKDAADGAVISLIGSENLDDATLIYDEGATAEQVKADIIGYYREGVMPEIAYENDLPWDDVKFSIEKDKFGDSYWRVEAEKDIFKGVTSRKELQKAAYEYILRGDKGEVINEIIDGEPLKFTRISANEYVYGRAGKNLDAKNYSKKMRMAPSITDLIENAAVEYHTPDYKNHKFAKDGFRNYRGRVRIDDVIFTYVVRVGENKTENMFYDINLEVESILPSTNVRQKYKSDSTSKYTLSQNDNVVNSNIRKVSENDTLNFSNADAVPLREERRGRRSLQGKRGFENDDVKFSIDNIVGDKQNYGEGVYLDTDIFDGVKPRNWNKVLAEFVYNNLAGESIEIFNSDGTAETINFAKTNERVTKDGANNSHKVIDKLTRAKGNVNSLAVVHIDELLQTSKELDTNEEHSHQWLDENGWKYRRAYLIDKKGQIYETTLNIAKAKDGRNILYALSNTKKVDDGVVFSASNEEELAHNDQLSLSTISQNDNVVNSNIRKVSENDTLNFSNADAVPLREERRGRRSLQGKRGFENDDVKFSIDDDFISDYNKWVKRGRKNGVRLHLGITSDALQSIGVKKQKITWDTSKINKSLKEHSYLNDEILKQIPEILENPIIVMQSKKSNSRLTMFGEVYDADGLPIMAVIELLPTNLRNGFVLDEVKVVSTHSRKNIGKPADMTQTQNLINSSKILYVDPNKKRTDNWLVANRLQLPLHITNYGSINKITYSLENVNSSISQNAENDTNGGKINETERQRAGNDILSGDVERRLGESAGEQSGRILKRPGAAKENGGRRQGAARSRELYAETVRKSEGTEVRRRGLIQCEFVKESHYSDEMKNIAAENSKKGFTTHFFVGEGKHILKKGLSFRGAVRGNEIFIQCDNTKYSPEQINKHELIHREYKTEAVQKIRDYINSKLSEKEKRYICDTLYANYRAVAKGDPNAIFEEFVCDVMAGMNDYAVQFEAVANEYWSGENSDIDIYSPASYTESIDAGGADITPSVSEADSSLGDGAFSLVENVYNILNSLKGKRGIKYNNGRTIKIPDNDMAVLRHKYKTEEHYSNRSDDIMDCISCFGNKGNSHYFYVFYVGEGGNVAPILRLNYEYISSYIEQVEEISSEMGYKKDEFINTAQGNGKGIDRIRNIQGKNSPDAFSVAERRTDSQNGGLYSEASGQRSRNHRQYDSGILDGTSDAINDDSDIKFSFSDPTDTAYLSDPIQQIKDDIKEVRLKAEVRKGKVYTTAEVRQVAASILENIDPGTSRGLSMSTGDKAAMMVLTNRVLNASESEKAKHIKRLSAFIAQRAVVYNASDTYDYAGDLKELRAQITHTMKLTDADKAVLDGIGASGYKSLFGGGDVGVDVVYDELSSQRPDVFPDDTYATDTKLLRIVEMYNFLKDGVSAKSERLIDVLKTDDRRIFAEAVEGEIRRAFSDETLGRDSKLSAELKKAESKDVKTSVDTKNTKLMLKDINAARKAFVEYAKKKFPKSVININTQKEIGISRTGIDKFLSGNISKEKLATGYEIPKLLRAAKKVGEAENKKGKSGINGYEYYENYIKIDDKEYAVHIRVRNTDMGDKYYGHTISEIIDNIEIEPLAWNSDADAAVHSINASGSDNNTISQDNDIVNSSIRNNVELYTKSFSEQIERYKKGEMKSGESFDIGKTPEVLKRLGAGEFPVVMTQSVMKKITGDKHNVSFEELKKLPLNLSEPLMVFKSDTVDNAYVILTEMTEDDGNAVIVALHISRSEGFHNVNRVASVYGKSNIENFLNTQIDKGNLKYIDKNKSLKWLRSRGLQLPKLNTISSSNNNILQKEDIVNSSIRNFSENDIQKLEEKHRREIEHLRRTYEKKIAAMREAAKQKNERKLAEKGMKPKKPTKYKQKALFGENDTGWVRPSGSGQSSIKKEAIRAYSVSEIINFVEDKFGIPITAGNMTAQKSDGEYNERGWAIRTRIANSLPTVCFELGEHLERKYKLSELESFRELSKFVNKTVMENNKDKNKKTVAAANFVRVYLENKDTAKEYAPSFYEEFKKVLDENGVLSDLDAVAKIVSVYMNSDFGQRASAAVVSGDDTRNMIGKAKEIIKDRNYWIKKGYMEIVDSFAPIKDAMDYVEKQTGRSFDGRENAYVMATNSRNADSRANFIMLNGMTDLEGNITGEKSLMQCIEKVKDLKLFDEYLVLRHSLEWLEPKSGRAKRVFADETLNDAEAIRREITEIEKANPEFKAAANDVYEYQRNLMKYYLVESGGMKQEFYDKFVDMYAEYVPFFRVDDKRRIIGNKKGKQSFANQVLPIKMANGGTQEIKSPLESIAYNTNRFVKFATRNQVAQMFADYADNIDGMGSLLERVRVGEDAMPGDIESALERHGGNADDISAVSEAIDDSIGTLATGYNPAVNAKKRIVSVLRNGEVAHYQVHNDLLYEALAELSPTEFSWAVKMSRAIMAPMKVLTTSNNFTFTATNAMRDIITAYNSSTINNPAKFIKSYIGSVVKIVKDSPEYKKYMAMGGGSMSELSASRDMMKDALNKMYLKDAGKARRFANAMLHPISTISAINDIIESTPRFSEYLDTVTNTGDKALALYKAQDLTTNFKRTGKTGHMLNSIFMYNNAAIQGMDRLVRSFTEGTKEERIARVFKHLIQALLLGIFLPWFNRENDKEGYENLSAYTKNNYYMISIGDGKFIRLPKAREMGILTSLVERSLDKLAGEDEAFYDFGGYIALQLIPPMLPDDISSADRAFLSVARNTIFGSLLDVAVNEDFKGSPIVSSAYEDLPKQKQYNEKTTYTAYAIGQIFRQSPMEIDHILSSTTGILGQMDKALLPMGGAAQRDLTLGMKNKFVSDSNYSTDVLNKVYERRDAAKLENGLMGTAESALEYEKYRMAASYVSEVNARIKELPADEQREARSKLLSTMKDWSYELSATDKAIITSFGDSEVGESLGQTSMPKSDISWTEKKQEHSCVLSNSEYEAYTKDVLKAIEKGRTELIKTSDYKKADTEGKIELIKAMDSEMKSEVKKKYQQKYGGRKK